MSSSVFARLVGVLICLIPSCLSALEVHWYTSDAAGIAYRETSALLSRMVPWALEIRSAQTAKGVFIDDFPLPKEFEALEPDGRHELAVLRENGTPRLWRATVWRLDGTLSARLSLQAGRTRFERANKEGEIVEEQLSVNGVLIERSLFICQSGRRQETRRYRVRTEGSEELVYTDRYQYLRDGSLRRIKRQYPEAGEAALVLSTKRGRTRRMERIEGDGSSIILLYDEQARERAQYSRKDASAAAVALTLTSWDFLDDGYSPEAYGGRRIEYPDLAGGGRRVEEFNRNGELVLSILYADDGSVLERSDQLWEAGFLMSVITEKDGKRFETRYERDNHGSIITETGRIDGIIQRVVRFSRETAVVLEVEEVYVNGTLRLIVRRENGVLVSEERIHTEIAH